MTIPSERPLVVLPGCTYVTAGTTRRSTGTHYTPPTLTEPVVQHTLEPLVYQGPAEGWPREQWQLKSPKKILELKVCDMAMGSGAFLVQACRYLAERLVEAWENEEKRHPGEVLTSPEGEFSKAAPSERLIPQDSAERIAIARRVVADRCLYGVDINPMAVEMAKLSMWLITVDKHRPFTFLDHAFKCGDSLLGITSLSQLENFSLRPDETKQTSFATLNLWRHIDDAKSKREALEAMPSDTPEQIVTKMALFAEAEEAVAKLNAAADVLLALEFHGLTGKAYDAKRNELADHMMVYWAQGLSELQNYARQLLGKRDCFHWALAYPEIIGAGGFHAFIGNPPFMGGLKISEYLGDDYNTFLMLVFGAASKKADLCAYFFQRVYALTNEESTVGLLATNTISQGVTRRSSLEVLLNQGCQIHRSIKSFNWPGQAAVIATLVHFTKKNWQGIRYSNGNSCTYINALLDVDESNFGQPHKLLANDGFCFQGVTMWGDEFFIEEEQVAKFMAYSPSNEAVIKKAMGGKELNTTPLVSPTRWAINFGEMDRSEAMKYDDVFSYIEMNLHKKRQMLDRDKYKRIVDSWWKYFHSRSELFYGIKNKKLTQVLARSRVSDHHMLAFIDVDIIYTDALIVFLFQTYTHFALLQSSIHDMWVRVYASSMKNDVRYGVSDCFDTYPFPLISSLNTQTALEDIGNRYDRHRQSVMQTRLEGLTKTYNRFHNPTETAEDIAELRRLHVEMDNAVVAAYGWEDLPLDHGFHDTKQGLRYTISETARREVLDRLLELNHQRYAEEVAAGLHDKKAAKLTTGKKRKAKSPENTVQMELF